MENSCLVAALRRYLALSEREKRLLDDVRMTDRPCVAGQAVISQGSAISSVFVLREGFAIVRSQAMRGRSSIIRVYLPGELIGLCELAFAVSPHAIQMQTDGMLCEIDRASLAEAAAGSARIASLLLGISSIEQVSLRDHCTALGLMTAEERLIQFFLDLQDRMGEDTIDGASATIHVPFSQSEIGEAVGMTPVYVNKLLRKLSAEGRITVERPHVTLHNFRTMRAQTGFASRNASMDTSWFPASA